MFHFQIFARFNSNYLPQNNGDKTITECLRRWYLFRLEQIFITRILINGHLHHATPRLINLRILRDILNNFVHI